MARPDYLNVYLLTFNCGRALINPSAFAPHLFAALKQQQSDGAISAVSASTADPSSTAELNSRIPDLIVLNLQEVAPIAYAFLGGSFLTPYLDRFTTLVELAAAAKQQTSPTEEGTRDSSEELRPSYVNVITRNIGLTAIMIFVRTELISRLDGIMSAEVGVGVQATGNKGAVGVRLGWRLDNSTSSDEASDDGRTEDVLNLTFVSAHLAPMEGELQRRNEDFKNIVRGLVFTSDTKSYASQSDSKTADETAESEPLLSEPAANSTAPTLSNKLQGMYTGPTHLFFAGDLNYRTSIHPPSTAEVPSFPQINIDPTHEKHYSHLLQRDQLNIARRKGETLHGLSEQEIHFPPTYKYKFRTGGDEASCHVIDENDTQHWEWASHRWPSWCDRILFFQPPTTASTQASSKPKSGPDSDSNSNSNPDPDPDPGSTQLIPQKYTALPMLTTSDHRPVALSVLIPLVPISAESSAKLSKAAPVDLDPNWQSRRAAARRREIVVGISSYLTLTREGNAFVIGGIASVLGGLLIARSWGS